MKEALQFALQIAGQAEELKPAARQIVDAIKLFGPELAELIGGASDYLIDRRAAAVKRLEEKHGFTREEAIILTLDVHARIDRQLRENNRKKAK